MTLKPQIKIFYLIRKGKQILFSTDMYIYKPIPTRCVCHTVIMLANCFELKVTSIFGLGLYLLSSGVEGQLGAV